MSDVAEDPLLPLLLAARQGDDRAVTRLVEATRPAVWRVCRRLGSPGAEEDLVQECYMRALIGLERYQGSGSVLGWILTIARNTCVDDVRRRQRQAELTARNRLDYRPPDRDLASWLDVTDAMYVLDADQRDAFVLTQLLGFAYGEASELLGCPIGTVRSRVARARARLFEQHREDETA